MGIEYMKHLKFFVFLSILTFTISCGQQKQYIKYRVKEGESMRIIANRLDVNTSELLRLNPGVGRKPLADTFIVVPNNKTSSSDESGKDKITAGQDDKVNGDLDVEFKDNIVAEGDKRFVGYQVKKGDTFYGLTRFYNVSKEEMIALNPELTEGLKENQIIKIREIEEGDVFENQIYDDVIKEDISLKMAMLLPFRTDQNEFLNSKDIFLKSKLANIVADFYLGAEIAIDSLKKQGVKVELNVFDTQRSNSQIQTILAENNLNDNDVIIGPLYSEQVNLVVNNVNVPVVLPVYSKNQSKYSSSKLIKTSPNKTIFRDGLITYINDNFTQGNLILVVDGSSASNASNDIMKKAFQAHDSISYVNVLKPIKGYIEKTRFLEILKPNTENWIVLTSNDDVLVADAINSLISLPEDINVRLFAVDKGDAFDKIDNFKLAKVNLTYVSDEFIDETSRTTQLFNKQYYSRNNVLPSFYATKGFDITYDVLIRLASGKKLKSTFKDGASFRIESKFDYTSKAFGSVDNNGLFIVQYQDDLTLIRLK